MVHTKVAAQPCDASGVNGPVFERFPARETSLGTLKNSKSAAHSPEAIGGRVVFSRSLRAAFLYRSQTDGHRAASAHWFADSELVATRRGGPQR